MSLCILPRSGIIRGRIVLNFCESARRFGQVHKARWRNAIVAVKIVNHSPGKEQIKDMRILRETLFSSALLHPNIVSSFLDVFLKCFYFVLLRVSLPSPVHLVDTLTIANKQE